MNRLKDAPPGNVTVTFTWQPQPAGDPAVNYTLSITKPDGSQFSIDTFPVSAGTQFQKIVPNTPGGTYGASLVAVAADGTASDPATTTFIITTPPPPQKPATPQGFSASVGP